MRKRIFALFAAACLALALAGCGGSASSSSSSSEAASSSEAEYSSASSASQAASSSASSSAASSKAESAASSEAEADAALEEAFDELLKANPISNQFEIADMNIEYDFGLDTADVVSYKGVKSNDNGDAGLVLIMRTPAGRVDAVREALETYLDDQAAFYGNYSEFTQAQANVERASVAYAESDSSGLVILVIPSGECTDTDAIAFAKENAIDISMG